MLNKRLMLTTILVVSFILTGCNGQGKSNHQAQSNSTSSSSQQVKTPEKSASDQATMKPYKVPSAEKNNRNYRKSGLLSFPGQFAYDQAGTKLTLSQNKRLNQKTTSQGINYQITDIKRFKNNAKTKRALQMAQQAFNIGQIPNPYQTLQIKFNVKNTSSHAVKIDGIQKISLNGSRSVAANGISDPSAGQVINKNSTRTFSAMILVGPTSFKVGQVSVQFSGSFNDSGQSVAKAPAPIIVNL
ncbi:hypothetical protein HC026_01700 [Lactobacillus sp. LC28-10]|uniref:DUF4352 domain-containing protein n=1 Tax=Secundilactobacillus angelensis TaxID=2722706 RepID=A0ABX1KX83_9LACO|nr:hypothetical protein [Secundilactobacillus angelensis]MCH5461176.1 hypothetical protein [Secundilactobacillus angelensis]NLR17628.1 hypothetical protein [Secundilactobacillus angelensis]